MLAYKGELEKTVTFKDKVRLQPENVNAGLLTYPVLQAADIILHRATLVPVGKDQEQHLEMARTYVNGLIIGMAMFSRNQWHLIIVKSW